MLVCIQFGIVFFYFTRRSRRIFCWNSSSNNNNHFSSHTVFFHSVVCVLFHCLFFTWFQTTPHRCKIDDTDSITIFSHIAIALRIRCALQWMQNSHTYSHKCMVRWSSTVQSVQTIQRTNRAVPRVPNRETNMQQFHWMQKERVDGKNAVFALLLILMIINSQRVMVSFLPWTNSIRLYSISIENDIPKSQNLLAIRLPMTTMTIKLFNRISVNDKPTIIESKTSLQPGKRSDKRTLIVHTLKLMLPLHCTQRQSWYGKKLYGNSISWFLFALFLPFQHDSILTTTQMAKQLPHTSCSLQYFWAKNGEKTENDNNIVLCVFMSMGKKKNLIISGLICVIKQTTQRDKRVWWRWQQ